MNAMFPRCGARSPPRLTIALMALSRQGVINTKTTHINYHPIVKE